MEPLSIGPYEFLAPARIVFGWGRLGELGPAAVTLGGRAFLVVGSRTLAANGTVQNLQYLLRASGVEAVELATISREPEVSDVDDAARRLRLMNPRAGDLVLGMGGGSAIDLAKAVAAMATSDATASVRDYLEGVGQGLSISSAPLPVIAIPTTAGTGSEATKNAVISSYDPPFKKSLRSNRMMPRIVIVDPQLTISVPSDVTAQTGMDAVTQLIESYISRKSRPMARALAAEGLRAALPAIVEAVEQPQSRPAREAMAHAALLSGMALANSGLGMAHGVAAALGVHRRVPHGLACAAMLGVALRVNRDAALTPLGELATAAGIGAGQSLEAAAAELIDTIDRIIDRLGIPQRLSQLGVSLDQIPVLARDSRGNSMDGNPRLLSDQELTQILTARL